MAGRDNQLKIKAVLASFADLDGKGSPVPEQALQQALRKDVIQQVCA